MTVIDIEDVSFRYTDIPVLKDVSLAVESGEFLGLVGPNGSGKTTLLKIALGLRRPDTGAARLFGDPAHAFDDGARLGYVGQGIASADRGVPVTVNEVVTLGRFPHAGYGRLDEEDHRIVKEAMQTTGIDHLADRRLQSLSGGQRQRTFIARALASEADLLALDEPTVGVDAESRDSFYALLRSLNEQGITIVLIEHDLGVVTEYATTVACINRHLHYHGDPREFTESDAIAEAYGTAHHVLEHDHDHP